MLNGFGLVKGPVKTIVRVACVYVYECNMRCFAEYVLHFSIVLFVLIIDNEYVNCVFISVLLGTSRVVMLTEKIVCSVCYLV